MTAGWRALLKDGETRKVLGLLVGVGLLGAVALLLFAPLPTGGPASPTVPVATAVAPGGTALSGELPAYEAIPAGGLGEAGPGWTDVVGLIVKLGLVLALLVLALRGIQRFSGSSRRIASRERAIEVLESSQLAQGTNIFLVAVGQRVLLLGGTQQQVALLTELEDPALLARLRPARPASSAFSALLNDVLQRGEERNVQKDA